MHKTVEYEKLYLKDKHALWVKIGDDSLLFDVATSNIYELENKDNNELEKLLSTTDSSERINLIQNTDSKISKLYSSGKIFGTDSRKKSIKKQKKLRLHEVVVQVAYSCNMACTYCYADEGEYGGGKSYHMNEQVARDTVDFAFKNRDSDTIGFGLLGGEPLINFKVFKEFVTYARKKGAKEGVDAQFSVTTNGLPLTPQVIKFLEENNVSVRLSVDGTKKIHDKYRPDKKGLPTFDRINNDKGARLRNSDISYMVRSSIFGPEGDQIMEQVKTLFEDYNYKKVKIDFLWGEDGTLGLITEENLHLVYEGIDKLGKWYSNKVLTGQLPWHSLMPFSKYIGRLRNKPNVSPIYTSDTEPDPEAVFGPSILENNGVECGAGVNVVSVSANGDLYSCHRTEGNPDYKIGTIYDGVNHESLEYWSTNWRLENPDSDCTKCWARYACIGGCPAFGVYKHKDPMKIDRIKCHVRRRCIAWSIWLHHQLEKNNLYTKFSNQTSCEGCAENCNS